MLLVMVHHIVKNSSRNGIESAREEFSVERILILKKSILPTVPILPL